MLVAEAEERRTLANPNKRVASARAEVQRQQREVAAAPSEPSIDDVFSVSSNSSGSSPSD